MMDLYGIATSPSPKHATVGLKNELSEMLWILCFPLAMMLAGFLTTVKKTSPEWCHEKITHYPGPMP